MNRNTNRYSRLLAGLLMLTFFSAAAVDSLAQAVINNGKMRFGNGSEASINGTGNLQQPFYYSTDLNAWRKLTYSSQPLSQSIGFNGDGANAWNTNGMVVNNLTLTNQVIDDSDFIYDSGSTGPGHGTIVSTGIYMANGYTFSIENAYTIEQSSFITIRTVIENVGTQNLVNLRYWVGTGDDYVGGTDSPMKERGNLIDGSFEMISAPNEQAKALRIKTASEGVLFFSTSDRAYNIIGSSYGWGNVLAGNPSDSPITIQHDGSYGMYIRMNDLAPGQSDEFTWYYAAAKLSDLDGVVAEVAEAAGGLGNVTCNSAIYEAQSSVAGTGYLMVVPDGSTAPTASQLKAGGAYGGINPVYATSQSMAASVQYDLNIPGLSPSTNYQAYFVVETTAPEFTEVLSSNILTAGNPEISFTVINAECGYSGQGQLMAVVTNATAPVIAQWTGGPESAVYSGLDEGDYEVHITDANNCQATATGTVSVEDNLAPNANARDVTIYLDAFGSAALTAEMVDDASTDSCGIASLSISRTTFDCEEMSAPQNVVLTVTDAAGHSATAGAQVTILDTIRPVLDLRPTEIFLDASGQATLSAADVDNGSSDNCGIVSFSFSQTIFNCASLGSQLIDVTAADASGNQRTAQVEVTVSDNIAPQVETDNTVVYLGPDAEATVSAEQFILSEMDNCEIVSRTLSRYVLDCADQGVVALTLTVKDASDNVFEQEVYANVIDSVAPTALPANITAFLNADGFVEFTYERIGLEIGMNSYDNCGSGTLFHDLSQTTFTCSDLGENTVMYNVQDPSGNISTAEVVINIEDNIMPTVAAHTATIHLNSEGVATLSAEDVDNGSADNCGITERILSKTEFLCSDVGSNWVEYIVMDASGNSAQTQVEVIVEDRQLPQVSVVPLYNLYLNEDGSATLSSDAVIASASDNCGIAMKTLSKSAFGCADVGLNSVSIHVHDAHGNIRTMMAQINVIDTVSPEFSLESVTLELNAQGMATLSAAALMPYAQDNCEVSNIEIDQMSFSCEDIGENRTAQITVFDTHGNSNEKSLLVEVIDRMKPVVNVENTQITLNHQGVATLAPAMLQIQEYDNCGIASRHLSRTHFTCADVGIVQVKLTVTDFSGNSDYTLFNVAITDAEAPQMFYPALVEMCEGTLEELPVTASDNCSVEITQVSGPAVGDALEAGVYQVIYAATDPSGNTATAEIQLIVKERPSIDLGADTLVAAGSVLTFDAGDAAASFWLWSTGETTSSIELAIDQETTLWVEATSEGGCMVYDEIHIGLLNTSGIDETTQAGSFRVYPNPASEVLYVKFNDLDIAEDLVIQVLDLTGKVVYKESRENVQTLEPLTIPVSQLAKGVYLINLRGEKIDTTQRFIRQ